MKLGGNKCVCVPDAGMGTNVIRDRLDGWAPGTSTLRSGAPTEKSMFRRSMGRDSDELWMLGRIAVCVCVLDIQSSVRAIVIRGRLDVTSIAAATWLSAMAAKGHSGGSRGAKATPQRGLAASQRNSFSAEVGKSRARFCRVWANSGRIWPSSVPNRSNSGPNFGRFRLEGIRPNLSKSAQVGSNSGAKLVESES